MTLPSYAMNQQSFPEMYEQFLVGPLFRPYAESIMRDLDLSSGDSVLDIACGTGIVSRLARERVGEAGRVVGVDRSSDMLAVASKAAPQVEFREGRAEALPLQEGEQFDAVVCHQGFQFFGDKAAAVAEMRRALKRGGKLAVATWRSDGESPFLYALRQVAERHLGSIDDKRYNFPETALTAYIRDAGFNDIQLKTIKYGVHFDDGRQFVRLNAMAFVGLSAAGEEMDAEQRRQAVDAIVADSASVLSSHANGAAVEFDLGTNIATAQG